MRIVCNKKIYIFLALCLFFKPCSAHAISIKSLNLKEAACLFAFGAGFAVIFITADFIIDTCIKRWKNYCKDYENARSKGSDGTTNLMCAADTSNIEYAQTLLKNGANVNAQQKDGLNALAYARDLGMIQLLLQAKADPNIKDNSGSTTLGYIGAMESPQILQELIQAHADVNSADNKGVFPLLFASSKGQYQVVQMLVEAGNADVNKGDNSNATPLMWASRNGHTNIVDYLVEHRAHVNAVDNLGNRALDYAQRYEHTETVKTLAFKHGAHFKCRTPAVEEFNFEEQSVDDLPDGGFLDERPIELIEVAGKENIEQVTSLVSQVIHLDAQDTNGHSALMQAASVGNAPIVQLLLDAKANPNVRDKKGFTALQYLNALKNTTIVQALLKARADINNASDAGYTPLVSAASHGYYDSVIILTEAKADINQTDNNGKSPLFWATEYNHTNVVEYLAKQSTREKFEIKDYE